MSRVLIVRFPVWGLSVLNKLIVLITIAIPIVPLCIGEGRNEIARWYIAAAANAKVLGDGDPDAALEKAAAWGGDTVSRDVWLLRLKWTLDDKPTDFPTVFRESQEHLPSIERFAEYFASKLCEAGHFTLAVETLLQAPVSGDTDDLNYLNHLNSLAYFRSLAVLDLDQALVDIELALTHLPAGKDTQRRMFLDTRAWVLFNLGRHEEALVDINKCLSLADNSAFPLMDLLAANSSDDGSAEIGQSADATDLQLGALRYHRAKILEALGRKEEAEKDFDWLRERNLPIDGTLY